MTDRWRVVWRLVVATALACTLAAACAAAGNDGGDAFAALTEGVTRIGGYGCCPNAIMTDSDECLPLITGSAAAYTDDRSFSPGTYPPIAAARSFGTWGGGR